MYETYHNTVAYLETLTKPFGPSSNPEIYLRRMQYFLDMLGNPERDLKVVHVTGTAGKGSVSRLVQSMLANEGHITGLFTSPYVTAAIEQIQVNELYIDPSEFVALVEELKPAIEESKAGPWGAPSYFEITTALAFLYFKRKGCEWAVLEVGLGGRYDSTNVIKTPRVTAITTIDYDHMNVLGNTLEKIAYDKAGIIKKDSVFLTTEQRPSLLDIFSGVCKDAGATFRSLSAVEDRFHENNLILARAIARELSLSENSIKKAISGFKLPARFEIVKKDPVVIIDGAHNPIKIRSVVERVRDVKKGRVIAVVAFSDDKDVSAMIDQILSVADEVVATHYVSTVRHCRKAEDVAAIIKAKNGSFPTSVYIDPLKAFTYACTRSSPNDMVIVTGSFYLAGTIRKLFYPEEHVLRHRTSF